MTDLVANVICGLQIIIKPLLASAFKQRHPRTLRPVLLVQTQKCKVSLK